MEPYPASLMITAGAAAIVAARPLPDELRKGDMEPPIEVAGLTPRNTGQR
jgi:hypothetical protein